jgi:hypothetical protein
MSTSPFHAPTNSYKHCDECSTHGHCFQSNFLFPQRISYIIAHIKSLFSRVKKEIRNCQLRLSLFIEKRIQIDFVHWIMLILDFFFFFFFDQHRVAFMRESSIARNDTTRIGEGDVVTALAFSL